LAAVGVEYHRIEAGWYVAYRFVGISDTGNADIASMSQAAFDDKMRVGAADRRVASGSTLGGTDMARVAVRYCAF
jgi:hypothetical protein